MANVGYVKAIFDAETSRLQAGVKRADKSLSKFGKAAGKVTSALRSRTALAFAAVGAAAAKMASDFESSMTKIETLVGRSAAEVERMEHAVKQLAGETARAPNELAEAMFFIASAGLEGSAATDVLTASARASAVGLGDTATVADLATSALNAYGAENLSAVKATDILTAAVREGKLQSDELAGSMGRVLPIASAMGVGFDEVGAAFAALSRTGTNASEAATQLRQILASILRPTKQSEEAMQGLGLSAAGLRQQIKDQGLLSVLKTLAETFDGQSDAAAQVFGNIRALMGVMDLLGKNSGTTEEIFSRMADTTGMVDQAFERVAETSGFKMNQAMTDLKLTMIELGDTLLPVVVPIIEGFAKVVGMFTQVSESARIAKAAQEELTAAFVDEGDEASLLVGRLDSIIERHNLLTASTGTAASAIEEFTGQSVLLGAALQRGVGPELEALGLTAEQFEAALSGGTDEFQKFAEAAKPEKFRGAISNEELIASLREQEGAIGAVTNALADQFDGTAEGRAELRALLGTLDATSAAYAGHTEKLEADAKATLDDSDKQAELADILGAQIVQGAIDAAHATGNYASMLRNLTRWADQATTALEAEAAATALAAEAVASADRATIAYAKTQGDLANATEELDFEHLALLETERRRKSAANTRFVELLQAEKAAAQALKFEYYALLDTEQARKRSSSDNWAVNSAQLLNDNLGVTARRLLNISDLESMILGTRQASADEARDATKNVISLLRADRQVRMTEKAINALLDERNELLGIGTDDDAQSIEQMKQQQEAITAVEEELIKMGTELRGADRELEYLTEAQARANNITGEQAQQLRDATRSVFEAQAAFDAGYGSVIDLSAAEERLAEAHQSIFTGSQDVAAAEERLVEIDESLATASEELALDQLAVNDAQSKVAASGGLAKDAALALATMFTGTLGPAAGTARDDLDLLVQKANEVFPEFDELRVAMEGIHFGMTPEQTDAYVRSVRDTIDFAGMDLPTIDTMLSVPETSGMLDTMQTEFDNAGLVIPVAITPIPMPTLPAAAAPSPGDQAVLDWLDTPEARAFLGIPAMAAGGIVTGGPQLAMIGESGPEAVIPLGRGGMGTTVNVNVAGSILTESEIGEIVQEQLLRIQARNQTLEFA